MRCYVEFITTPTRDISGTTLVLHYDERRYLIGQMPEGTQRASIERKIGLRKLSSILLTGRTQWSNTGGLLGMILELADVKTYGNNSEIKSLEQKLAQDNIGSINQLKELSAKLLNQSKLHIFGAPNLIHMIATARRFVFRRGMPMNIQEYRELKTPPSHEPTWADDFVRVWVLPLRPTSATGNRAGLGTRKRSHDESEGNTDSSKPSTTAGSYDDAIRKNTVNQMFDSNWRKDKFLTLRLSEVKLPAVIFVRDPRTNEVVKYTGPMPGGSEPFEDIEVLVREPWPASVTEGLPRTTPKAEAISYIVKNHLQRGKFMPEKAMELKVPKGPLWSALTKGHAVQNLEGETITPDMVLQPSKPGKGFAVIDLPDHSYIDSLLERPEWTISEIMDSVQAIVWVLAPGLASDPRIRNFQTKMSHLKHFVSSRDCCADTSILNTATSAAVLHHHVDSRVFPLPQEPHRLPVSEAQENTNIITARPGLVMTLEPHLSFSDRDGEVEPPLNNSTAREQLAKEIKVARAIVKAAGVNSNEAATTEEALPHGKAEIIVLGTGSSHPSVGRNVSGTLVRVPGCGSYLFDCGEGSLGALRRILSPSEVEAVLRDLRMIWISHLHADHHMGTTSFLKARYEATKDLPNPGSLAVVSEIEMLHWLHEYSCVEEIGLSNILPLVADPLNGSARMRNGQRTCLRHVKSAGTGDVGDSNSTPLFLEQLNLKTLNSVYVNHCRSAQAVSVTFQNGLKISYSGDCRPSAKFAQIGRNSDVLIHEATFEDSLRSEALQKRHCTVGEALIVAGEMKARTCVLTHFSQRYVELPPLGASTTEDSKRRVSVSDPSSVLEDAIDLSQQPSASLGEEDDGGRSSDLADENGSSRPSKHPLAPPGPATTRTIESVKGKGPGGQTKLIEEADVRRIIEQNKLKVIFAFDYMRFKLEDIPHADKLQPALRVLYEYLGGEFNDGADVDNTTIDDAQDKAPWIGKNSTGNRNNSSGGMSGADKNRSNNNARNKKKDKEKRKKGGA